MAPSPHTDEGLEKKDPVVCFCGVSNKDHANKWCNECLPHKPTEVEEKDWKSKVENILYTHFGAMGISISMNDGNITDGATGIRDKAIKEVLSFIEKVESLAEARGYARAKANIETAKEIVTNVNDNYLIEEEAWHKGMQQGMAEARTETLTRVRENIWKSKINMLKVYTKEDREKLVADNAYNKAIDDVLKLLSSISEETK